MLSAQDGTPILASQDAENYASSIKMMREVDARLIAAAPEMAELLERLEERLQGGVTMDDIGAIRALLAKIKGETNA